MIARLKMWLDDRKWRKVKTDDFAFMSDDTFFAYYTWIRCTKNPPAWYDEAATMEKIDEELRK